MHFVNELCYTLIISIFSFLIFIHFTNQITSKQCLAQKLNLIFPLSLINWQINIQRWTCTGHKGWRKNGKTFARCYTIPLELWHEFNAKFVLLHFSCYRPIKFWHLYLENVEKNNNVVHLRLVFTYFLQNVFNIKNILLWYSKRFVDVLFCVFQTNLNKAVNRSEIYKLRQFFSNIKTWMRVLHWLTQRTEKPYY